MLNRLRTLGSDTLIYGGFTIVGRFLTFLLTPLYTNYLTLVEMGDMIYLFTVIPFLNIVYSFGMESSFFRFYSKDDPEHSKKVFSHAFITIMLVSGFISLIIYLSADIIAESMIELPNGSLLVKYTALIPFLDAIMIVPFALMRMKRKTKRFSAIKFSIIALSVVLNILFVVLLDWGALGPFVAQMIASGIGGLLCFPEIIRFIKAKYDKSLLKEMLLFGLPTVPASFSAIILQVADRQILKPLTDSVEVALYSVNYRLGIPMMMFVTVFEYAWKPFYLSHFEEKDAKQMFARVLTYFTLVGAGIFLLVGFYMDFLVRLPFIGGRFINPEYWQGMGIIPIILAGYFFNGVYSNFAAGFHIEKKTKFLPIAIGLAALANIVMNLIMIPYFGYWGSAWATVGAYFISAAVLYYFARNIYPINYEWKRLWIIFFVAAAVYYTAVSLTEPVSFVITNPFFENTVQISYKVWLGIGSVEYALIIRTVALAVFVSLLWLFRFFDPKETAAVRRMIKRK